jgi:flagellar M-ring protein FliF
MTDANVMTVSRQVPMAQRLNQGLQAVRTFLRQPAMVRAAPMMIVAAVIAIGLVAILIMRDPSYIVLFPQLEEADKATVLQTLSDKGIKAKLDSTTGQMTVPRADFYRAKMLLA